MRNSSALPARAFEHTHARLTELTLELRRLLPSNEGGQLHADDQERVLTLLQRLREELLDHFASEEEGLFPFLRSNRPDERARVDRLEKEHGAVCQAIARLVQTASHAAVAWELVRADYDKFERLYAGHSSEEWQVLDELGRSLTVEKQTELTELLRSLA